MSNTPNNQIPYVPENTIDPAAGLNISLDVIDALLNTRVESMTLNTPPGSPADGAMYVVGRAQTGAWTGHSKAVARWTAEGAFWTFYAAGAQAWFVINKADNSIYTWNAGTSSWTAAGGIADAPSNGSYFARRNGSWQVAPGGVQSVQAGTNVTVDATDPLNPIVSAAGASGVPEAPNDGTLYGRKNAAWVAAIAAAITYDHTASGLVATNVQAAIDELKTLTATPLQSLVAACSDETTALTAGVGK